MNKQFQLNELPIDGPKAQFSISIISQLASCTVSVGKSSAVRNNLSSRVDAETPATKWNS